MLRHLKLKKETTNWCLSVDDEKLSKKYKAIWTKIKDLNNIELNALQVYNDKHKNQNKNIQQ